MNRQGKIDRDSWIEGYTQRGGSERHTESERERETEKQREISSCKNKYKKAKSFIWMF